MSTTGIGTDDLAGPGAGEGFAAVDDEEGAGAPTAGVGGGDVEVVPAFEDVW